MIGDSQKGGLHDLLRNKLRIFLNLNKIKLKELNEKKLKKLKKLKLKKKKEAEIRRYFIYQENKFKKVIGPKIPLDYACSIEYHEINQGYASNVICSNDGEILARTIYDASGRAILECSSKEKFNKLIHKSDINLNHYSKIIVKDNHKITTIKPNQIRENNNFNINEVVFQDNVISNKPIDIISENEFISPIKTIGDNGIASNIDKDKLSIPKVVAGISLYSTVKLVDTLINDNTVSKENVNKKENNNKLNEVPLHNKKEDEILEIVNKFIKDSSDEIKKMHKELDDLSKQVDEEYDKDKLEEIYKKYLELKEKIEKLKRQFEVIKHNTNFMDFNELDDSILWDKIDDYKFSADNKEIEALAHECQKELEKMEQIIILYEDSKDLEKNIDEKEEQIKTRDNAFQKDDKKLKEIEMIDEKVKYNLEKQEAYLKKIADEVSKIDLEHKKEYKLKGFDKLLANVAKMTAGFITLPFSGKYGSVLLGSLLINNAVKGLKNSLKYQEENKTYIRYTDFAEKIKTSQDKLELANHLISDSLEEMQKIKRDYHTLFEEYKYKIPEYEEMLKRIEAVEENLDKKQKQISEYRDSFTKKADKNKVKMKKIDEYRKKHNTN